MKNKLIFLIILTSIISGCSNHKKDDPLIVPPAFTELPDPENPEKPKQSDDKDLQELKELLLKN